MSGFEIAAIIFGLCASIGYANIKLFKLPLTIALMLMGVVCGLALLAAKYSGIAIVQQLSTQLTAIDFSKLVLDFMLCFLLFAGALQTDFLLLKRNRNSIALFSLLSVLFSTFIYASIVYTVAPLLRLPIGFTYCLLLGAILSPTDPIAILGLLTKANIPKRAEINIVGESLFNDGIGIVLFVTILGVIEDANQSVLATASLLFLQQAIGGIVLGVLYGKALSYLLNNIDDYEVEILITLAVVCIGYWLAHSLGASGPLAMVVAGLLTGHHTRLASETDLVQKYLHKFWHLVDVILNAVLFLMMGLKVLDIAFEQHAVVLGVISIGVSLLARYFSLLIPYYISKRWISIDHKLIKLMTWGGLRGGLSIAMALSLGNNCLHKQEFAVVTYVVVLFSIFVQALTMPWVVKKLA
jgi:monovalent cation:H+ antiporter, CPA1 family